MSERLTMDEIKARHAPDWVLIGEPETDESHHVLADKVLFHSPSRKECYRKAIEMRPGDFAFEFLGERRQYAEFTKWPWLPSQGGIDPDRGRGFRLH